MSLEVGHLISLSKTGKITPTIVSSAKQKSHSQKLPSKTCKLSRAVNSQTSRREEFPLQKGRKGSKVPRGLITISGGDGKRYGDWNSEYLLSLHDLNLQDLIEDQTNQHSEVSVTLSVQKHASFGFSVNGRIVASFIRKCSNCFSPYCRKIDTNFQVWILPSSRVNPEIELPEIGGDDPSVIYVKPGYGADLDSLIQDTIRLNAYVKDTCSESCEKSVSTVHYIGKKTPTSVDKRWAGLLELKKKLEV